MQIEGSDALDFNEAIEKGFELFGKSDKFGFLIICGVNFGLRISDLLTITYGQLKLGEFVINEKKRGKKRKIVVNSCVKKALKVMEELDPVHYSLDESSPFRSQKGTVYSSQHVNRKLKKVFPSQKVKITSHSLRKGFGKQLYEKTGHNIALVQLALRHSSPEDTLRYIGVTQQEMDDCYNIIL